MGNLIIRPPQPGDGEGLARVWLDMATYYAWLDPEVFQVPRANGLAEWFEERLLNPTPDERFTRVAEQDGRVVGTVSAFIEDPFASAPQQMMRDLSRRRLTVNALGVHTACWRHGIGRRLLEAAEEWGRSKGATVALLDTYVHSPVSVPFYEQGMGYSRQSVHFRKCLA
jgi:GNAT superfamily N-acetyltransferase